MDIFDHNKQLLSEYVGFDPDDIATFDNSINELINCGAGLLKEISLDESDTPNWVLLLTNEEECVYYLEITAYGNIAILREDGPDGEIIIQGFKCGIEEPEDMGESF